MKEEKAPLSAFSKVVNEIVSYRPLVARRDCEHLQGRWQKETSGTLFWG